MIQLCTIGIVYALQITVKMNWVKLCNVVSTMTDHVVNILYSLLLWLTLGLPFARAAWFLPIFALRRVFFFFFLEYSLRIFLFVETFYSLSIVRIRLRYRLWLVDILYLCFTSSEIISDRYIMISVIICLIERKYYTRS